MIATTKHHHQIELRKLASSDFDGLLHYLHQLSPETKSRFGPHLFDTDSVIEFYRNSTIVGFVAEDFFKHDIIAYAIIKTGYLEHDSHRLQSYGLVLNHETDCTFEPSVADGWQGAGVGGHLFNYILVWLRENGFQRIILWGGVQASNHRAVQYYQNKGFKSLGGFEYNGWNYDMILDI